ncbi:MAG: ABC transporter ATP-binding protein [Chthonomonadales bacterium]|nr:ABC transporter ATP-binding protein [Chthonomonadales bacterium]
MRSLHRALRYVIPYWRWQVAALLCALLVTASEFVWPWMNKVLIDQVLWPGGGDAAHRVSALNLLVVVTVSAMIAGTLLGLARSYMFARVSERAAADLRRDLFRHVHALPMAFYDRRKTGGVMSVVQNDVEALQGLYAATLVEVLTNILMVFVASGLLIWRSPTLAAIGLPVPVAFAVALALFGRPLRNAGRRVRDDTGAVQEVLQESIAGVREVRIFGRAAAALARYMDRVMPLVSSRIRQAVMGTANGALARLIAMGGMTVVLSVGARMAIAGSMSAGDVVLFLTVLGMLFGPASAFVNLYAGIAVAMGAADRIFEFCDAPAEAQASAPTPLPPRDAAQDTPAVSFTDVGFRYDAEGPDVLCGINLEVRRGEVIALVGPSGSGKTTLVSLIPRLYDVTAGAVLVHGLDVRSLDLMDLRSRIAFVPQEPYLFGTTVAENIRFGKDGVSDDEVLGAARAANAHAFIEALPEGYATQVGERGTRLSVGQKQRIAIARAILRDPELLILDEATSAQDSESERLVQEAVARLMQGRTAFVIAHRLSTVHRADRIVVLDSGRITEIGRHEELVRSNGLYARLHSMQFGMARATSP